MSGLNDYRKMNPFAAGPLAELNFEALLGELKPGYLRCSTFSFLLLVRLTALF